MSVKIILKYFTIPLCLYDIKYNLYIVEFQSNISI